VAPNPGDGEKNAILHLFFSEILALLAKNVPFFLLCPQGSRIFGATGFHCNEISTSTGCTDIITFITYIFQAIIIRIRVSKRIAEKMGKLMLVSYALFLHYLAFNRKIVF